MLTTANKTLGRVRSLQGPLAKALSISLYPRHRDILQKRERELNVPRSILLQLLLEVEERDGLLRQELINRLAEHLQTKTQAPRSRRLRRTPQAAGSGVSKRTAPKPSPRLLASALNTPPPTPAT